MSKEVELRERMMFTRARVVSDVNRIISLYRRSGFYTVTVSPKIIRLPQNRVDLVFEINEGGETKVKNIEFVGNDNFSASDLRGVVGTQEARWWKFFARNDTYDPDRLEYDKELLRRYYLRNGFADVRVIGADAVLSPDGEYFNITYTVEEGPKYKIADVAVNVGEANLDPEDLKKAVRTGVGDVYDAGRVDATVERLTLAASRQGFVFAKVNPNIQRNEGDSTLNITYNIVEGTRTYIERIEIVGNSRTEDRSHPPRTAALRRRCVQPCSRGSCAPAPDRAGLLREDRVRRGRGVRARQGRADRSGGGEVHRLDQLLHRFLDG